MNPNRNKVSDGISEHLRRSDTRPYRSGRVSGDGADPASPRSAGHSRIDLVAVNAAMCQLVLHRDPEVVLAHLTQLLTTAVCDEASADIVDGDSDGGVVRIKPAGRPAAGMATSTRGAVRAAADGDPARFRSLSTSPGRRRWADRRRRITWLPSPAFGGCTPPTAAEVALLELLARCAAGVVQQARQAAGVQAAQQQIDNLTIALGSNRIIGAAVGVLMTRHQLAYKQAFQLLRAASQHTNTKIGAVVDQVLLTGELPA